MANLTERSQKLAAVPDDEIREPCEKACLCLLVDDYLWRCEDCLRYYTGQTAKAPSTQLTQGELF